MNITLRNESPADIEQIHSVTEQAFLDAPHTDHTEQFIVKALRDAGALTVSLVAEHASAVIGHVAISPVRIGDGAANWYGLGPISVLPAYQDKGVGAQLMEAALAAVAAKGAAGCVVLGDPGYYSRFGFTVVDGLVLPGVPAEYFQALAFTGGFAQGEVSYHQAFSAQA
ncbi:GNAT family N-acetyltransferase [Pseudomonas sp.]|uniref:GNAT family N-acetyltransferase n=1 Tax=Pseudomonas sp. TaxID=306 RepID=UPI003C71AE0C